jgi:hypothetical protein
MSCVGPKNRWIQQLGNNWSLRHTDDSNIMFEKSVCHNGVTVVTRYKYGKNKRVMTSTGQSEIKPFN